MKDVPARELRNHLNRVLRRLQAGQRLRVTVSGRPVAELVPLSTKPCTLPASDFWPTLVGSLADAGLTADLRAALPDTTDDVKVP